MNFHPHVPRNTSNGKSTLLVTGFRNPLNGGGSSLVTTTFRDGAICYLDLFTWSAASILPLTIAPYYTSGSKQGVTLALPVLFPALEDVVHMHRPASDKCFHYHNCP
ncbi:hypothetical protein BJ165DRAFT_1407975 [Panaeolus papilionaceus]|nr:hypothetical protein BJ165DRAFT_1407975 [Panaeolus papilionaceus]